MSHAPAPSVPIDSPVWGADLHPAGCAVCGRGFLTSAERIGQPCPACGRGNLEARPALMRQEPPELIAPFKLSTADLAGRFETFAKDVWLRPDDLSGAALASRAVPVFWPMWLVDGQVVGHWEAELGFDYKVESARESLAGGQWRSEKLIETRARWEPRAGLVSRSYDNVATPALSDHARWLKLGGSYPEMQPASFSLEKLGGAVVCIPDLVPEQAWPVVRAELERRAGEDCREAAGAQHVRRIALRVEHSAPHWTQLLLPAFLSYYKDDEGTAHPILVNAVTGKVGGRRMASQQKGLRLAAIIGAVALTALFLGLIALAAGALLPPVALLGVVGLVAAIGLGIGALVPAIWPWQWNRGQTDE